MYMCMCIYTYMLPIKLLKTVQSVWYQTNHFMIILMGTNNKINDNMDDMDLFLRGTPQNCT